MNASKAQLVIEFNVSDLPTLTEIFKKFKVKTRPARPSVDEVEQLIIKKALRDAKAIDKGTVKSRPLDDFLAELKAESMAENVNAKKPEMAF